MRKLGLGLMVTISISVLAGCGNGVATAPGAGLSNGIFGVRADGNTANAKGKKDLRGEHGMGGPGLPGLGVFSLPADLNLTAEQKTQIQEALKADKPVMPDKTAMEANRTAMEALRKEISDAFISENFDAVALKAKLDALKPAKPGNDEHITEEATRIVKIYNILTADQRQKITDKITEVSAKVPREMPVPPANIDPGKMEDEHINKIAASLGLTDDQKAKLKDALKPPSPPAQPDFQAEHDKRKAAAEALSTALKSGNVTVESISAVLKANAPTEIKHEEFNELDVLAKVHSILNADQRKKFIDSNKSFEFGPGGHRGYDFPGGPGGKPGMPFGPGRKGPGMPFRK
jgi:Spy/CpxP family protein refolding chaperone